MVRQVHMKKWNLIKIRQELNRSYKEICIPVLEKCRFLLYEVKPAVSVETEAYKKVNILYREPRVKALVKKVIKELKCGRHTSDIQKPEDIVNATIQSQGLDRRRSNEDLHKSSINRCSSDGKITESKSDTEEVNKEIKNGSEKNTVERVMTDSFNSTSKNTTHKNCMDLKTELEEKWNTETNENDQRQNEEEKIKKLESNIALSNLLFKLTEKEMKKISSDNLEMMTLILDFLTLDNSCEIEVLRRAMYCQVKRCKIRKEGLEMILQLLNKNYILTSVKYGIFNGYLGLMYNMNDNIRHCLDDIQLVTPSLKTEILLAQMAVTDWCVTSMRNHILKDFPVKQKTANPKVTLNLNANTLLRDVPRARLLLAILGILASNKYFAVELNPLVNSGVVSSVLSLLRQTGRDQSILRKVSELYVLYADMVEAKKPKISSLSGPELASLMKLGTRVVRGADWKWGDQASFFCILK